MQAGKPHVEAVMVDEWDRWSSGTVHFPFSMLTHVVAMSSLISPLKHKETVSIGYS